VFIADQLIFLELQKTGGSHIRRLLERYTDGEVQGKHNRLLDAPDRAVISTIRNPWDWYVSLWAYGVGGKGAIRARVETGVDFDYYYRMLPKTMGKNWLSPGEFISSLRHDIVKPVSQWQQSYQNSADPKQFQAWLRLLFDKKRRFDIGEGYGFSPVSECAGLLTYRYLRLLTLGDLIFHDQRLSTASGIEEYDAELNIASSVIRIESLEEDFVRALIDVGVELSEQQVVEIVNKQGDKTNVSERKPVDFYYDKETAGLVADGDAYLIKKYGYVVPV
jgi:hypothetical protein